MKSLFILTLLLVMIAPASVEAQKKKRFKGVNLEEVQSIRLVYREMYRIREQAHAIYQIDLSTDPPRMVWESGFVSPSKLDVHWQSADHTEEGHPYREVAMDEIRELVEAINAPGYDRLTIEQFGFTEEWVAGNVTRLVKAHPDYSDFSNEEISCLETAYRTQKNVEEALGNLYSWWNHKHPFCRIQFIYPKDTLEFSTNREDPYMLPWSYSDNKTSFNRDISLHLAHLLDPNQRDRENPLYGEKDVEKQVAIYLLDHHCEEATQLRKIMSHVLEEPDRIQARFDIRNMLIKGVSSINWDYYTEGKNWNAEFHPVDELPNLLFDVTAAQDPENPTSLQPLLAQQKALLDRVKSVNFLRTSLEQSSRNKVKIHFTRDRSVSPRVLKSFRRDAPKAIWQRFEPQMEHAVFITWSQSSNWSRWLLFADGTNLLWHFQGDSPMPGKTVEELTIPGGPFVNSCKAFDAQGKRIE